jgi:hypothetical protein
VRQVGYLKKKSITMQGNVNVYIHVFHSIFEICSGSSPEHHYYLALHEGVVVCLGRITKGFFKILFTVIPKLSLLDLVVSQFRRLPHTKHIKPKMSNPT